MILLATFKLLILIQRITYDRNDQVYQSLYYPTNALNVKKRRVIKTY